MKIDTHIGTDLNQVITDAPALEKMGYDGVSSAEVNHDAYFPLILAAEHTKKVDLITSIVVAFARTPMTLATQAHELNAFSKGRLILGMGSQIKPHISRRFSMPWSKPAARMKEMIEAMHAIWDCFYENKPLQFNGEFYTHNLMTPMFMPENTEYGRPKVYLAAVGPGMTKTAAQVADGILLHSFTNEKYIREVTIPTIEKTLDESGRKREDFELKGGIFVVTADTEEKFNEMKTATRKQIAFYGSTPAYREVLDIHGWSDLHVELNRLSKIGEWDQMGTLIDDEVLNTIGLVAEPKDVAAEFKKRFGDIIDRTALSLENVSDETAANIIQEIHAA